MGRQVPQPDKHDPDANQPANQGPVLAVLAVLQLRCCLRRGCGGRGGGIAHTEPRGQSPLARAPGGEGGGVGRGPEGALSGFPLQAREAPPQTPACPVWWRGGTKTPTVGVGCDQSADVASAA